MVYLELDDFTYTVIQGRIWSRIIRKPGSREGRENGSAGGKYYVARLTRTYGGSVGEAREASFTCGQATGVILQWTDTS